MTLDPKVFKAYDVRGVVPAELDADGAYRIARAYVDHVFDPTRIAIGHDMRLTSPELVRGRHPRRPRRRRRRRRASASPAPR